MAGPFPSHVQPTNLNSPVPGGGDTLQSVLGNFKPLANTQMSQGRAPAQTLGDAVPSLGPTRAPAMSPPEPDQQPQPDQAPQVNAQAQAAKETDPNDFDAKADKIFAELQSQMPKEHIEAAGEQHYMDKAEAAFALAEKHPDVINETGTNRPAPWQVRAVGAIPKTTEGQLNMFKKIYGVDNAKYEGGQFFYREKEDAKWNAVAPAGVDFASMIPEAAQGVAAGMAAAPFVAAAGASMNPVPAFLAGTAAEGAAMGAMSMMRNAADFVAGVDEAKEYSAKKDFLNQAGIGAVASVAGFVANKALIQPIKGILANSLENRMEAAIVARGAVDAIHDTLMLPHPGMTKSTLGKEIRSGIDYWGDYLTTQVGLVKQAAVNNAEKQGMKSFPIDQGMAQLRKMMGEKVTEDAETGALSLLAQSSEHGLNASTSMSTEAAMKASQASAWGDPGGQSLLKELVDKYNAFNYAKQVNGGVNLQTLNDTVTYLSDRAAYNKVTPFNHQVQNDLKAVRASFAGDQEQAFTKALDGTDYAGKWKASTENYHQKIDLIAELGGQLTNQDSAAVVDMLLTPQRPDALAKLQQIIGRDSPQMEQIRTTWLSNRIGNAIDKAEGVFNAKAFIRDIDPDKWGPEMMEMLVPDGKNINQLKSIANQVQNLQTSDFWKANADKTAEGVGLLTGMIGKYHVQAAKNLYRIARVNPEFANYMAHDGINALVKSAKSEEAIKNVMQGMGIFESLVNNSTIARVGKAGAKVLVPASARTFAAAFADHKTMSDTEEAQTNMDAMMNSTPQDYPAVQADQMSNDRQE